MHRINNISNIIEGVERKISDVIGKDRASNERMPAYMNNNFEVNYPYGGVGGIPVVPSRNMNGANLRSQNVYDHLR